MSSAVPHSVRAPAGVGALVLAATVYLAVVDPNRPGHYFGCPVLAVTGMYCAGCGALRAVHDLAHLDLAGAWGMNPLLVVAVPALAGAWVRWLRRSWAPSELPRADADRRSGRLAWAVLAALVGFTILRNVPVLAPWLAP